jgi:formylglycine-generating enzyme required for sulfatase activity
VSRIHSLVGLAVLMAFSCSARRSGTGGGNAPRSAGDEAVQSQSKRPEPPLRSPLPPGFEEAFIVPDSEKDQYGNPVVVRNGVRTDPVTGWAFEVWLKRPRIEFVLVPAGEFLMGSLASEEGRSPWEVPQHRVRFARPFYMGKYEVTQGQWASVIGENPSFYREAGGNAPVDRICWDDCTEFLAKLSDISVPEGAQPRVAFCLPSEAQWEYACRAGSKTRFHYGDACDDLVPIRKPEPIEKSRFMTLFAAGFDRKVF